MAAAAAMSIIFLGGLLVLIVIQPAAGQQAPAAAQTVESPPAARQTFIAGMRNDLAEWRGKMAAFDQRTDATGHQAVDAASTGLRAAWVRTEEAGRRVEGASAQDWDEVKASYDSASHDMAVAWHKVGL